jgi:hypothetical protein
VTPLRLRLDPTHDPARRRVTNEWNQALVHRLSLHLGTTGCRTRLDEGVLRGQLNRGVGVNYTECAVSGPGPPQGCREPLRADST